MAIWTLSTIFDWRTGTRSTGRALSVPRSSLAAAAAGSFAIFAGGSSSSSPRTAAVDIYNAATGGWTQANLAAARAQLAAASVGDAALFIGGVGVSGSGSAVVDIFNATLPASPWSSTAFTRLSPLCGGSSGEQTRGGGGRQRCGCV